MCSGVQFSDAARGSNLGCRFQSGSRIVKVHSGRAEVPAQLAADTLLDEWLDARALERSYDRLSGGGDALDVAIIQAEIDELVAAAEVEQVAIQSARTTPPPDPRSTRSASLQHFRPMWRSDGLAAKGSHIPQPALNVSGPHLRAHECDA